MFNEIQKEQFRWYCVYFFVLGMLIGILLGEVL
jgi:hypothetical protein